MPGLCRGARFAWGRGEVSGRLRFLVSRCGESWWGPEGFHVVVHALEARVGGRLNYDMVAHAPEQVAALRQMGHPLSHPTHARFTEVKPCARLVVTNTVGVEPERADFYELADGTLIELPVAHARIEFMGSSVIVKIIFGPEGAEPILGAIALEAAGFSVDPTSQSLRRLAARSLKKIRDDRVYTRVGNERPSGVRDVGEREERRESAA